MSNTNSFTVNKHGKYYNCIYIKHTAANAVVDLHNWANMYQSTRDAAEIYMQYVMDIEKLMVKYLRKRKLQHDPTKICRFYLKLLDGISCGLDVRSSWSKAEVVERLVEAFNTKYIQAQGVCEYILNKVRGNRDKPDYMNNWREYEYYTRMNDMYELGMDKIEKYTVTIDDKMNEINTGLSNVLDELKTKTP